MLKIEIIHLSVTVKVENTRVVEDYIQRKLKKNFFISLKILILSYALLNEYYNA